MVISSTESKISCNDYHFVNNTHFVKKICYFILAFRDKPPANFLYIKIMGMSSTESEISCNDYFSFESETGRKTWHKQEDSLILLCQLLHLVLNLKLGTKPGINRKTAYIIMPAFAPSFKSETGRKTWHKQDDSLILLCQLLRLVLNQKLGAKHGINRKTVL